MRTVAGASALAGLVRLLLDRGLYCGELHPEAELHDVVAQTPACLHQHRHIRGRRPSWKHI
ncbi:hypothetical protein [Streptomyces sp. NPDC018833]|uniref:hypothetical protein n=1 Tax=Streptomyces sp. NPDC018833 TaxID=3365053 RepID=UPI0037B54715